MSSAGMKDAKCSWRPQFLHALLMRVSLRFKRIHSQASGFKSAVDFKWAEQFNRWDMQLQGLFEDRLLLRGYKYKAAAVRGVCRGFFFFVVLVFQIFVCRLWGEPSSSSILAGSQCTLIFSPSIFSERPPSSFTLSAAASCSQGVLCSVGQLQGGHTFIAVSLVHVDSAGLKAENNLLLWRFFNHTIHSVTLFSAVTAWLYVIPALVFVCLFFPVFSSLACQALARKDLDFLLCRLWPYWETMVFGFWCTSVWSPESGPFFFFSVQSSLKNGFPLCIWLQHPSSFMHFLITILV